MKRVICLVACVAIVGLVAIGCAPSDAPGSTAVLVTGALKPTETPAPASPVAPTAPAEVREESDPDQAEAPAAGPAGGDDVLAYQAVSLVVENAAMLEELAGQVAAGAVDSMDVPFVLTIAEEYLGAADAMLAVIVVPPALMAVWEDVVAAEEALRRVVSGWEMSEINSEQALTQLEAITADLGPVLEAADAIMTEEYGYTASELEEFARSALAAAGAYASDDTFGTDDEPLPEDALELVADNRYVSGDGTLVFIGLVRNNHATALDTVKVRVRLNDAQGAETASYALPAELAVVQPGETAPFKVGFYEGAPEEWESYDISFSAREWEDLPLVYTDFRVTGREHNVGVYGELNLYGEIENTGNSEAHTIRILVVLLDSSGKIVGIGEGAPQLWEREAESMMPGDVDPFLCVVQEWIGDWSTYVLSVEAYPEF